MSRRRSPPRRPPSRGCSRRSSAQFAGKVHSSSCYCYYYHMAATSIPTLERRLRELLRERSVTRGDFTLASGRRSTFYIDARRTTMSGEGLVVIGALGLARLTARGWAPDLVGGLTLGADPVAYAVAAAARAEGMPLDAFSVRKQAKAHGTGKRIEGCFRPGAAGVEQRLKDLETIARSHRMRRVMIGVGFVFGLVGWAATAVKTRPTTMVLVAGGAAFVNELLGLIHERGWYRWWLVYALSLFDVILVAVLIVWFGNGGLIAAFFLAVLPYAFDQGHTVGNFLVLTAALAYLGASFLHNTLYEPSRSLRDAGLETVVFIFVAMALKRIPATLIARIRHARSVMGEAERGYLAVRAPAGESDELGFLERSFNRMIEEIGGTISTVQREADEVAALAEQLAASAEELHATSETVTHTTQRLATDLGQQREMAEGARGESAKAAEQAESLRVRAELMPADAAPRAMQSGETKVRDIGAVAAEADAALQEVHQGIELVGDLVNATAEVSRGQAQRLAELAQSLQQVAAISSASSARADGAAGATQAEITSMGDLTATSQQLAQLAERLRGSIARFSVLKREQEGGEPPVTRAAAD